MTVQKSVEADRDFLAASVYSVIIPACTASSHTHRPLITPITPQSCIDSRVSRAPSSLSYSSLHSPIYPCHLAPPLSAEVMENISPNIRTVEEIYQKKVSLLSPPYALRPLSSSILSPTHSLSPPSLPLPPYPSSLRPSSSTSSFVPTRTSVPLRVRLSPVGCSTPQLPQISLGRCTFTAGAV